MRDFKLVNMKTFPKGFTSWHETHFEVVMFINSRDEYYYDGCDKEVVYIRRQEQGQGGIYELASEWTDEFEEQYKDIVWGEDLDWFDTIEDWLIAKNKPK